MKRKIRINRLPRAQYAGQPLVGQTLQTTTAMADLEEKMKRDNAMYSANPLTLSAPPKQPSALQMEQFTPGAIPETPASKFDISIPEVKEQPFGQSTTDIRNQEQTLREGEIATNVPPNIAELQTPQVEQSSSWTIPAYPDNGGDEFDISQAQGMSGTEIANTALTGLGLFQGIGNAIENARAKDKLQNRFLADAMYSTIPSDYSGSRGDYTLNQGLGNNFRPNETVYGQFGKVAQYGGQMRRKIKITGLPQQAYGGTQNRSSIDEMYPTNSNVRRAQYSNLLEGDPDNQVRQFIREVPREYANIEAEKGETIVKPNDSGLLNMFKIGGKRHSEGGTPLQADSNDFIFSDTKDMKIKDPEILKLFGMKLQKKGSKGYTPAEISKNFNLNDPQIQKALNDPKADYVEKATAERLYDNYLSQLGKLALIQEGKKGFPQGPPSIAMPYMEKAGLDPSMFMPQTMQPQDAYFQMGKAQFGLNGALPGNIRNPVGIAGPIDWTATPRIPQRQQQNRPAPQAPATPRNTASQAAKPSSGSYKDFITYNKNALADLRSRGIKFNLPEVSVNYDITPGMQRTRQSGVFGTQEWGSGDLFNDFKKRNAWYFEQNPDFDPTSPEDVFDFQNQYNKKIYQDALDAGYSEEQAAAVRDKLGFVETDEANPRGTDKKFGQYTWSRSGIDYEKMIKEQKEQEKEKELRPDPVQEEEAPRSEPGEFWLQDVINTGAALTDRLGLKKYSPYDMPVPSPALMDPTFYDPSRELASIGESANIVSQNLGQFAGPQNMRASEIMSSSAKAAADTLGRYNNLNVGVANQFEQMNKGLINQSNMDRARAKAQFYDQTTTANQQYDNARRAAKDRVVKNLTNAFTNRGNTQVMNTMHPEYSIDPRSGGFMTYIPSKRKVDGSNAQQMDPFSNVGSLRQKYQSAFPNMSPKEIDQALLKQFTG